MKKALISPNEKVMNYEGLEIGVRIAQVENEEFLVAKPLFWIECPNECTAELWYYSNGNCLEKPVPPIEPEEPEEPTSTEP